MCQGTSAFVYIQIDKMFCTSAFMCLFSTLQRHLICTVVALFVIFHVVCFCEPDIRRVFMVFDQDVNLEIPIDCLPVALRALGRIPSEAEMRDILNEFGDSKKGKI